jgi:hypothetical protein
MRDATLRGYARRARNQPDMRFDLCVMKKYASSRGTGFIGDSRFFGGT